jgi:hypothetical protein
MAMTEPDTLKPLNDTLEALSAATADSTEQCVATEQCVEDARSEVELPPEHAKAEPAVPNNARSASANAWLLHGAATSLLALLWQTSEDVSRRGLMRARAALAAVRRRVKAEIVTSSAVAGGILAAVFALTSAMILLLEQIMPAWRAALVTSGILAVLGFSLLQTQMVTDMIAVCARAKNVGGDVAFRVTELIRVQLRARERVVNRGGPV